MSPRRTDSVRAVAASRVRGASVERRDDLVAVEAPLGIEVDGRLVATTMRTPGDDRALALGFLLSAGVIPDLAAVASVEIESAECDLVRVRTIEGTSTIDAPIRLGTITSACGACGRVGLEELLERVVPLAYLHPVSTLSIERAHASLRALQPLFAETGGVHAAALFDEAERCIASAEDVGRHNAVDKAIGRALEAGRLGDCRLLVVSGRTSFEIVHKAIAAHVDAVAGVSAPSSLAIGLAERAGIVLAGFVRGDAMNVYTHAERLLR